MKSEKIKNKQVTCSWFFTLEPVSSLLCVQWYFLRGHECYSSATGVIQAGSKEQPKEREEYKKRGGRHLHWTHDKLTEVGGSEWQSSSQCLNTSSWNILSDAFTDDSSTIPPELNSTSREGESIGRSVSKESISRTGCRSFENGGKILERELLMAKCYLINGITVYIWIRLSTMNILFVFQTPASCSMSDFQ